jgi:cytoskeletal protein RodZ
MESPGKYLKAERKLRKRSLEEVAKFTKIKEDFLRAIEEDNYEILPPAIHVKGFLTIDARYLGLTLNPEIAMPFLLQFSKIRFQILRQLGIFIKELLLS